MRVTVQHVRRGHHWQQGRRAGWHDRFCSIGGSSPLCSRSYASNEISELCAKTEPTCVRCSGISMIVELPEDCGRSRCVPGERSPADDAGASSDTVLLACRSLSARCAHTTRQRHLYDRGEIRCAGSCSTSPEAGAGRPPLRSPPRPSPAST
jgi:hypothetical protein